uniref:TMS membrane family protein n=1 Tax=Solanum tuberosum TaxID=4113 RepID=M1BPQ2_SOLTU
MDARGSDHMEKQASSNIKCVTDKLHIAKISPNSYGWPLWFSCLSPKKEEKEASLHIRTI